jgi:DNA invertase Pin-like site-specific DNA recombinase
MFGIFAEFEREMIQTRIKNRVRAEMDRNGGKYTSRKSGVVRRSLGRPGAVTDDKLKAARAELARGTGIIKTAKLVGFGTGAVHKLRREMRGGA